MVWAFISCAVFNSHNWHHCVLFFNGGYRLVQSYVPFVGNGVEKHKRALECLMILETFVNLIFLGAAFSILIGLCTVFQQFKTAIRQELEALQDLNIRLTEVAERAIKESESKK